MENHEYWQGVSSKSLAQRFERHASQTPEKFVRDDVVAPLSLLSVVIVTLPSLSLYGQQLLSGYADFVGLCLCPQPGPGQPGRQPHLGTR